MNNSAVPRFSVRFKSRSMICDWIVTSSAVVGSSAMRSLGSHESAIAIIARCRMPPRQLMRIFIVAARGQGNTDIRQGRERTFSRLFRARRGNGFGSSRQFARRCVNTGSSALIGSWNTIAMLLSANILHLTFAQRRQIGAFEADGARHPRGSRRQQPEQRKPRHRFAAAALADHPDTFRRARSRTRDRR